MARRRRQCEWVEWDTVKATTYKISEKGERKRGEKVMPSYSTAALAPTRKCEGREVHSSRAQSKRMKNRDSHSETFVTWKEENLSGLIAVPVDKFKEEAK